MERDRFSNDIESRLKYYPTEVDLDQLWRKVGQQRKLLAVGKSKRRRNYLIFLLVLFLAFATWLLSSNKINYTPDFATITSNIPSTQSVEKIKSEYTHLELNNSPTIETPISTETAFFTSSRSSITDTINNNSNLAFWTDHAGFQFSTKSQLNKSEPEFITQVELLPPIPSKDIKLDFQPLLDSRPLTMELETKEKKFQISGGFGITSLIPIKKIENIDPNWLEIRQETEKPLDAFSADLLFQIKWINGFTLTSGLNYVRFNEKFTWTNSSRSLIQRDQTFYWQEIQRKKVHYNTFTYYHIPIYVGFEMEKKGWVLGGSAGALINLKTKIEGEIQASDLEAGSFAQLSAIGFRNYISPLLTAKLRLGRQISPDAAIMLEPNYTLPTGSLTLTDSEFDQRYSRFGLRLGIQWKMK